MINEEYAPLLQVIADTFKLTAETNNFDWQHFYQKMEPEFKRLGFRDNRQGGGWKIFLFGGLNAQAISF